MAEDDRSSRKTVLDDLVYLTEGRIERKALTDCERLSTSVISALVLDSAQLTRQQVESSVRSALTETALLVERAIKGGTGWTEGRSADPSFQAAAACELLDISIRCPEKFDPLSKKLAAKLEASDWSALTRARDNQGPSRLRRLRAGVWIGVSGKTVDNKRREIMGHFEAVLRDYLSGREAQLRNEKLKPDRSQDIQISERTIDPVIRSAQLVEEAPSASRTPLDPPRRSARLSGLGKHFEGFDHDLQPAGYGRRIRSALLVLILQVVAYVSASSALIVEEPAFGVISFLSDHALPLFVIAALGLLCVVLIGSPKPRLRTAVLAIVAAQGAVSALLPVWEYSETRSYREEYQRATGWTERYVYDFGGADGGGRYPALICDGRLDSYSVGTSRHAPPSQSEEERLPADNCFINGDMLILVEPFSVSVGPAERGDLFVETWIKAGSSTPLAACGIDLVPEVAPDEDEARLTFSLGTKSSGDDFSFIPVVVETGDLMGFGKYNVMGYADWSISPEDIDAVIGGGWVKLSVLRRGATFTYFVNEREALFVDWSDKLGRPEFTKFSAVQPALRTLAEPWSSDPVGSCQFDRFSLRVKSG